MNQSLISLKEIAQKESRTILGLMSGTSADGLDIALVRCSGSGLRTTAELLEFGTAAYPAVLSDRLSAVLFDEDTAQGDVLRLQMEMEEIWVKLIQNQLSEWAFPVEEIDLIASHGQTVLHLPSGEGKRAATWQLVDGDYLAAQLGIYTASDFRKKHIAAGFDGAPLAPLGERLLVDSEHTPCILLNLGGIANITYLEDSDGQTTLPFSTDTGPANTLIDAAVKHHFPGKTYDESGNLAASGTVQEDLLKKLKSHPFFRKAPPKSTGPEEFGFDWLQSVLKERGEECSAEDLIATLTRFSAWSVAREIRQQIEDRRMTIYASGGGVHNKTMIEMITRELPGCKILTTDTLGIPSDAKEAILFAVFANELITGDGWSKEDGTRFTLGKISIPG